MLEPLRIVTGTRGNDRGPKRLVGTQQDDQISGLRGNDQLIGRRGDDILDGGPGRDRLRGDGGDDGLAGGNGADTLAGGPGKDTLFGGAGRDTLSGGAGGDRFVIRSIADGVDTVRDFNLAQGDRLDLLGALQGYTAGEMGSFIRVTAASGRTVVALDADGGGDRFSPVLRLEGVSLSLDQLGSYGLDAPLTTEDVPAASNPSLFDNEFLGAFDPAISADGRLVAYRGHGDFDNRPDDEPSTSTPDIFVQNFATGAVLRVNTNQDGDTAIAGGGEDPVAENPSISADGRYVAFQSNAVNLVFGDTNANVDVFVKDLLTGRVERASTDASGGEVEGGSLNPWLAASGRMIAFDSDAPDLVQGDVNAGRDVFVKNLATDTVIRISSPEAGEFARKPVLSADGEVVAFESFTLVNGDPVPSGIYVAELGGAPQLIASATGTGDGDRFITTNYSLSANSRFIAFATEDPLDPARDANGAADIYVLDRRGGDPVLASANQAGQAAQLPAETPEGTLAATPSISANGRFVAFESAAANLVDGDTNGVRDIFVKDIRAGAITRASVDAEGNQTVDEFETPDGRVLPADAFSFHPALSANARFIAFESGAPNLVGLLGADEIPEDAEHSLATVILAPSRVGGTAPQSALALDDMLDPASLPPAAAGAGRSDAALPPAMRDIGTALDQLVITADAPAT